MRNLNCSDGSSTADVPINTLLKSIFDRSWFTPVEAEIWSSTILRMLPDILTYSTASSV
jgi:hypothetical protein